MSNLKGILIEMCLLQKSSDKSQNLHSNQQDLDDNGRMKEYRILHSFIVVAVLVQFLIDLVALK